LYYQDLILKNLRPYINEIKKYFGRERPDLEWEMALLDDDPERTYEMIEYVTTKEIEDLLDKFIPISENKGVYVDLLWLVANLYYKDSHSLYQDHIQNDLDQDNNTLRWIQKDIMRLYLFLQDHPKECPMTISVGKDKVELNDAFGWFQSVMAHHVFPNAIPDIKTKEDAESILRKKAGRPETRTEVNAIVNGIARMFADDGLVKGKAPKELCLFIQQFLVKMELIEEDDKTVTPEWIKAQISNLSKPGKDPRFDSFGEVEECSFDDLKMVSPVEKTLDWILPPKL
jgi:hypothetical protein